MQKFLPAFLVAGFLTPIILHAQPGRGSQTSRTYHREHTIYLQGKVIMEDGSPPPDLVTIQRVCRGQVFPEGLTEPNGTFSVRLGDDATLATGDASTYGTTSTGGHSGDPLKSGGLTGETERFSTMRNVGTVDLFGCEIRAKLDGYRATPIILGRRNVFDSPNVGTIVLHPLEDVRGVTVSSTSLAAPKRARKAYERAAKELRRAKPNLRRAVRALEKALSAHPAYAAAWHLLGRTRLLSNDETGAYEAYRKALEADARYLAPYIPLIELSIRRGEWQRAREHAEQLLDLNPHAALARFYYALSCFQLGDVDEAETALQGITESEQEANALHQVHHLKGLIFAERGEFAEAAKQLQAFLAASPDVPAAAAVRKQLREWRALGVIE